jgi:hypothetical protein
MRDVLQLDLDREWRLSSPLALSFCAWSGNPRLEKNNRTVTFSPHARHEVSEGSRLRKIKLPPPTFQNENQLYEIAS